MCEEPAKIIQSTHPATAARAYYKCGNILVSESYRFFTCYVAFHISLTSWAHNSSRRCDATSSNGSMAQTCTIGCSSSKSTYSTTQSELIPSNAENLTYPTLLKRHWRSPEKLGGAGGLPNRKSSTTRPGARRTRGRLLQVRPAVVLALPIARAHSISKMFVRFNLHLGY